MSKVMLLGVLRMPPELWVNDSPIDIQQRYSRYLEAADLLDREPEDCRYFEYCKRSVKIDCCGEMFENGDMINQPCCPCNAFEKEVKKCDPK